MKVVITEKYNQGEVVANAILDNPEKKSLKKEPYWEDKNIVVVPLQGQIFEIENVQPRHSYPQFPDIEWKVKQRYRNKYVLLGSLLTDNTLEECIIATDYDREGEIIGTLAILLTVWKEVNYDYLNSWDVKVSRMRYSAMIEHEIKNAWDTRGEPDENLFNMGIARAEIDYRVGLNLSKGLSECIKSATNEWKTMSVGRVQTPTLKIIHEKTKERHNFDEEEYWKAEITVSK